MISSNKLLTINRLLQNIRQFHCSRIKGAYEGAGRTTVNILNVADPKFFICTCTPLGFVLNNDATVLGPLAIFPKTVLCWNVSCGNNINDASLSLFTALEPKLDILVLGLEANYDYKKIVEMRKLVMEKNISVEILPVEHACGVYNFLCEEGRHVAAGLIPPLQKETFVYKRLVDSMKAIAKERAIKP